MEAKEIRLEFEIHEEAKKTGKDQENTLDLSIGGEHNDGYQDFDSRQMGKSRFDNEFHDIPLSARSSNIDQGVTGSNTT